MMNPNVKITRFFLLICAAAVVLLFCLLTFFSLSVGTGNFSMAKFTQSFMLNLPFCFMIVLIDIGVIEVTSRFRKLTSVLKLVIDFIVTGIVIAVLSITVNTLFVTDGDVNFSRHIIPGLLVGGMTLLCVELYQLGIRHSYDRKRLLEVEKEKAKYQYEVLKNQINPHFLFNCLNVIASLTYESPEKTNLFTKRLSNVYRYLLSTRTKNLVSIADELKFTKEYVFLQQIRFEGNLKISFIVADGLDGKLIVPASVQMSVENAIKHNCCSSMNPLEIEIRAMSDYILVKNRLNRLSGISGTGTGVSNLREQFHNNGAEIEIKETDTEFIVKLPYLRGVD